MLAARTEADEGEIRVLAFRCGRHVRNLEFARDDLMTQPGDDVRNPPESISALVGDQNTQSLLRQTARLVCG